MIKRPPKPTMIPITAASIPQLRSGSKGFTDALSAKHGEDSTEKKKARRMGFTFFLFFLSFFLPIKAYCAWGVKGEAFLTQINLGDMK